MPIYNVKVSIETMMVVIAESEEDAYLVSLNNAMSAIEDADEYASVDIRGEITNEKQLRDGWDGDCIPYGGDGDTRLRELFKIYESKD